MVSETLRRGGLETRLVGQARALSALGVTVHFAAANEDVPGALGAFGTVLAGVPIGSAVTAAELAEGTTALAEWAVSQGVDVIHGHPFGSHLAAALVAALSSRPLALTLHGPSSLAGSPAHTSLLQQRVLPAVGTLRVVSPELASMVPAYLLPRTEVHPNAVDTAHLAGAEPLPDGPWLLLSRLADGKTGGLQQFLEWTPALSIREVHVAGAGPEAERLTAPAGVALRHLGWQDAPVELFRAGYAGVVGMGRALLEAAAAGLPAVLAGYEGVPGLLTSESLDRFAFANFSGRGLRSTTAGELAGILSRHAAPARQALQRRLRTHHDDGALAPSNAASYARTPFRAEEMARVRQLHGLLRRRPPEGDVAWSEDLSLLEALGPTCRQPAPLPPEWDHARLQLESMGRELRALRAEVEALAARMGRNQDLLEQLLGQVRARSGTGVGAPSHPREAPGPGAVLSRAVKASASSKTPWREKEGWPARSPAAGRDGGPTPSFGPCHPGTCCFVPRPGRRSSAGQAHSRTRCASRWGPCPGPSSSASGGEVPSSATTASRWRASWSWRIRKRTSARG